MAKSKTNTLKRSPRYFEGNHVIVKLPTKLKLALSAGSKKTGIPIAEMCRRAIQQYLDSIE